MIIDENTKSSGITNMINNIFDGLTKVEFVMDKFRQGVEVGTL